MNLLQFGLRQVKESFLFGKRYLRFLNDYRKFGVKNLDYSRFEMSFLNQYPCLTDWTEKTGFDAHYIYHPAWAARVVKKINPKKHIDISSTLTFCSVLSAFIPVEFYDYRPAPLILEGLQSKRGDLMKLPFKSDSVESISCMHTVEHIGLGRYGDTIDPEGDLKAIKELKRVVKKGGSLIFVTPVGHSTLRFNAHRIYAYAQIVNYFEGFTLKEYALLPDDTSKGLVKNASQHLTDKQHWGCGCFWFVKD